MNNRDFVHFHVHSDKSQFDGLAKLDKLVLRAREVGFPALALTDHGNTSGWIKFIQQCNATKDKNGKSINYDPIKPILGMEAYLSADHNAKSKAEQKDGKKGNRHLTLFAKNWIGYQNLSSLSQLGFTEGFYSNPRIDIEQLAKYSEGIIAGSACLSSVINANLLHDRYEEAKKAVYLFKDIFKEDFFLEIMYHGIPAEAAIIPDILKLSLETGVPVLATQDAHYIYKEDGSSQEVLMAMSSSKCICDPKSYKFPYHEFYLKNADEMLAVWKDVPFVLYNTVAISERIDDIDIENNLFKSMRLPSFKVPPEFSNPYEYLSHLAFEGLAKVGWENSQKHIDQLKIELEDVKIAYQNNGYDFATYFLIVWDYINYAKKQGILTGAGRGCLHGDVPVYVGSQGCVKNISDIKEGDMVICLDGKQRRVNKVYKYSVENEELITINSFYGDRDGVTLTPDHNVLLEKHIISKKYNTVDNYSYKNKKYEEPRNTLSWINAKDISIGDWVFVPLVKPEKQNSNNLFDLGQFSDGKNLVKENDVVKEIRYNPNQSKIRSIKVINRYFDINNLDFLWILGKFTADGWLRNGYAKDNAVGFAFNKNEKEQIGFLCSYFMKIGFRWIRITHSKDKNIVQIYIKSKYLHNLFKYLFKDYAYTSHSKYVPDIIFDLSNDGKLSYLKGLFDGDGSFKAKYKYVYSTVSKKLAYQVKFLLNLVGVPSSVSYEKGKNRNGYIVRCPVCMLLNEKEKNREEISGESFRVVENGFLIRVRKINKIIYSGYVYDLSVDEEHNYLTSSFIVHNSGYASVLLRCLGITYGLDPLSGSGLLWERFLAFDKIRYISESDFGFKKKEKVLQVFETEDDREVEEDPGGTDRY